MATLSLTVTTHDPHFELTVDPAFESLIPSVSGQAFKELEASVISTGGPEKPLVVWAGRGVLVDGHHRYRICKMHGLPFATIDRDFESFTHAQLWAVREHLTRRNLTPSEIHAMRKRTVELLGELGMSKKNAFDKAANDEGVSRRTVERSVRSQQERDRLLGQLCDEIREEAESVSLKSLRGLAKLPADTQQEVMEHCSADEKALAQGVKEAVEKLFPPPKPPEPSEPPKPTTPSPPPPSAPAPEPEEPAEPEEWDILPLAPPTNEQGKRMYLWAKGERNLEGDVEQCIERLSRLTAAVSTIRDRVRSTDQLGEIEQLTGQLYQIFLTWRGDVTRALEERISADHQKWEAKQARG